MKNYIFSLALFSVCSLELDCQMELNIVWNMVWTLSGIWNMASETQWYSPTKKFTETHPQGCDIPPKNSKSTLVGL